MKTANVEKVGEKFKVVVTMKLSQSSLKALLLQYGLLYKSDGPPKIIPFVAFKNKVSGNSYSWWVDKPNKAKDLAESVKSIHRKFKESMRERGFFCLEPVENRFELQMPDSFKNESPRVEDYLTLANFFDAGVILRGDIVVSTSATVSNGYKIDVSIKALHAENGREIGEVVRSFDTERGTAQQVIAKKLSDVSLTVAGDLGAQILEAWKKGTFGASVVQLTVRGDLTYKQLEELKQAILLQVRDIKSLKERIFEQDTVVFEMDTSSDAKALAQSFNGKSFAKFKVQVIDVGDGGLALSVKP